VNLRQMKRGSSILGIKALIARVTCFVFALVLAQSSMLAKDPRLPEMYAHWLNQEVNYLITSEERTEFLHLTSNATREQFIETFWKIRNPSPAAPTNVFKEEHYQRLAYANQHFGTLSLNDGASTARGMVYITLGEPAQIQSYPESKHLRPIQMWFYQNTSGTIPVHFYVLFYKPSPIEDYKLYSPTGDRPQKLINGTDAVNNDAVAIKIINDDLGVEMAHVALSLIPGEPVDLKSPSPSMQSDILLSNIRNYWNLPLNKERIRVRRGASEQVSQRIILGEEFFDVTAVVERNATKQLRVNYLLRFREPRDLGLAQQADGRFFYNFLLEAKLTSASGKEVYRQTEKLSDYLSQKQFEEIKTKIFGVEGSLPIAPGHYDLHLALTNQISHQTFQQTKAVLVPAYDHPLAISSVFFAANETPGKDYAGNLPFSYSGLKLTPVGSDNTSVTQGDPLRMIFQLWEAAGNPSELRGKTLEINYVIGQLGSQEKQEEQQTVDRSDFDAAGNLLIGRDFRTDILRPGSYRLIIKVENPEDHNTVYQSLSFRVAPASPAPPALWTLLVPAGTAEVLAEKVASR